MADLKKSPRVQQTVTESDMEFRNILMQSPSIFLILKDFPDMTITFANELLYKSWGRTSDIIGRPLFEILPELKEQEFPVHVMEVFTTGKTYFGNEEKATIHKGGQLQDVYYNYVYQANLSAEGVVTGVTVMATDVTEQVMARKKIEKKEKELTQLANTLPALLWVANSVGEVLYHNNQIENFWLNENLYDQWTWQDFCHPDDMQQTLDAWKKAIQDPGSHEVEQRLRMKDGSYRWHLTKAAPYLDENGRIVKWIGTTTDIHNHKLLEEKLKQNERRYRSLAKATTSIIWTTDPEGKFITEQISWSDYTGQNWNEYKEWGWIDMLHPDDREQSKHAWLESVEQKKEYEAEGRIWNCKLKEYRHFISHALPILNDCGQIVEWVGMNTDIHEQKLAEIKIRESEERFRLMADSSPLMVWLLDKEGRSYYYNKTLLAVLGKTEKDLETDNWDIEVHPDDRAMIEATIMEGVKNLSPYKLEGRIKRYDGEWRWILAHGSPRFGAKNEFLGFIGSSMDITERKQAEEQLKESEELFRHFSNNITNLAWMADGEGSIFWYNQRWLDYTGKTLEEMKGWGWQKVHHPDHVDRILEISKKLWPAGKPFELTFPLRQYSGEYRWFLTRAVPIKDKDGKVYKWIGTNTDINERVETAKALTLAKEQLELMFQNVPAAIYLFNDKGELLVVNDKGARIWGFNNSQEILELKTLNAFRKEIANRYFMYDEHGKQLVNLESATDKTFETGQPSEMTVEMVDIKNNKSIWLLSRSSPLFDELGKVRMVLNISTDITDQKKSEREIRHSEKRFRTLIEAFPQMAWIASPEGKVTYYNKSWYDQTGISEEEAMTQGGARAIHTDDLPRLNEIWQRHRISGQPLEVELRYRNVNEEKYNWFLVRGRPVLDENGNIAQWIGTCTNIQHLKDISSVLEKQVHERTNELEELNAKLEQQAAALKISNEDLQQFAHVASHDLKEPVRKIKTYSNRLRTEFQNQFPIGAEKYLEKVERSSERLYDLIDGILQYSSLDIDHDISSSVELTDLIRQIESDLEMSIQEKNAIIRYEGLPTVNGSPVLLHQLFFNLISNALKFSKPGQPSRIQVSSRIVSNISMKNMPGRHVRFAEISIQDNGIGFDQGQAEKIFKTFTRLHSKDHYEGTGLGLALCKKIVERHQGKITAEAQQGGGATFKIWLPV